MNDIMTFTDFLNYVSKQFSLRTAFIYTTSNVEYKITYNQFLDDIKKVVTKLLYIKNTYSDQNEDIKVMLAGENSYEWIVSFFAIICSEMTVVLEDKELPCENIAEHIQRCKCSIIFTSATYQHKLCDAATMSNIKNIDIQIMHDSIDNSRDNSPTELSNIDKDKTAVILFTSGSTGKEKGVMLSNRNIISNVISIEQAVIVSGRTIGVLPFHHAYELTAGILTSLIKGNEIVICSSVKNLLPLMTTYKPNYLYVVPMISEGILKVLDREYCNTLDQSNDTESDVITLYSSTAAAVTGGNLKILISGGAPLNDTLVNSYKNYGITLLNGYGISECSPVISVNRYGRSKSGSVGQALPGVNVSILSPDEDGIGEICISGQNVMKAYYDDPDTTKAVMCDNGFRTGDIGRIDENGFIYITGRIKNLIILSNGKNISPEKIENELLKYPEILETIIYGDHSGIISEIVPNAEIFKENDDIKAFDFFKKIIKKYNETHPLYMNISKVIINRNGLTRTSTGKIKRH